MAAKLAWFDVSSTEFSNDRNQLFGDHVPRTGRRAAAAREIHEIVEAVSVVKGQLFPAQDRFDREYPDAVTVIRIRFAIRFAAVVDQASGIPADSAVEI